MPAAPYQDHAHVAPSSQVDGTPEVFNPQDNGLSDETCSQEPELGSWSPVFNHDESNNQQYMPQSFDSGNN